MTSLVTRTYRYLVPLAAIIGVVLTAALVSLAFQHVVNAERDLFASQASLVHEGVSRRLTAAEDIARSLATLFNASNDVEPDEFNLFYDDAKSRLPLLQSIKYTPRVLRRDREAFERQQRRRTGRDGFAVLDDRRGIHAPAETRGEYLPITLLEPLTAETMRELGLDLLSRPSDRQAILLAIQSGEPVASQPVYDGVEVYTVFQALYRDKVPPSSIEARMENVSGVVAVTIAASHLLDGLQTGDHLAIQLRVESAAGAEPLVLDEVRDHLLDGKSDRMLKVVSLTTTILSAGQRFSLDLHWAIPWKRLPLTLMAAAAIVGISMTALLTALARMVARRTSLVESEVQIRTCELAVEKDRAVVTLGAIADGVVATDARGLVQYLNPVAERLTGWSTLAASGRPVVDVFASVAGEGRAPVDDPVGLCLRDGRPVRSSGQVWLRSRDGVETAVEYAAAPIRGGDGALLGAVLVCHDVSDARKMAEQMTHQATHDPLTGLPNRVLLMDRLSQALTRFPRHARLVAVLFLDLDNFKLVNDSLGHDVGDELVRQAAERLTAAVRSGDTVCRWGGDEFVLVLTDVADRADVMHLAEKIMARLDEPYHLAGRDYFCSASAGISVTQEPDVDPAMLLKNADVALYRAKESGRSNYQFYSDDMNRDAIKLLEVKVGLRHALDRQELVLHYQPQFDLKTGSVVGAEALVRWNHPHRGTIPPLEFIPLAEETGLIFPISEWVMTEACRQAKRWRDAGLPAFRMAVNLSGRQFRHAALAQQIARLLREVGLDPSALELELTESSLNRDAEVAVAVCRELKGIGVRFAIDDFGTGYSSLSYLRRFPVDTLKVDQSFVRELPHNDDDVAICSAIVAMGHSLGLSIVAEGVETETQLAYLQAKGFDAAQGYLLGHPMKAEAFAALLAAARPRAANE